MLNMFPSEIPPHTLRTLEKSPCIPSPYAPVEAAVVGTEGVKKTSDWEDVQQ